MTIKDGRKNVLTARNETGHRLTALPGWRGIYSTSCASKKAAPLVPQRTERRVGLSRLPADF